MRIQIIIDEDTKVGLDAAAQDDMRSPAQQAAYFVKQAVRNANETRMFSAHLKAAHSGNVEAPRASEFDLPEELEPMPGEDDAELVRE